MAKKFDKLTRPAMRSLIPGQEINEHGIRYSKLPNGDGRFTVDIKVDGRRIHRVIGIESEGVTRQHAEEFIEQTRTESRQHRLNLPKGRKVNLGFKKAADDYLERLKQIGGKDIKSKTHRLRDHLKPFFGDKPLTQIASFDIERYKKYRLDAKATPATINRELAVLSHLCSKAIEWKWLDHKPFHIPRLKEPQGRITYLTTEQAQTLLEVAAKDDCPHIYMFILIGLDTGMRLNEILQIQIENIYLDRRVIYIPKAKAGDREQPITRDLVNFLKKHLNSVPKSQKWLFPSATSKTGHIVNIVGPYRRVVEKAGLDTKEVVRHTLRHTAITHLVQSGVDLPTVKRISGHKTLQMVEKYSHQNGEHIQAAMDTLSNRYARNVKKFGITPQKRRKLDPITEKLAEPETIKALLEGFAPGRT